MITNALIISGCDKLVIYKMFCEIILTIDLMCDARLILLVFRKKDLCEARVKLKMS